MATPFDENAFTFERLGGLSPTDFANFGPSILQQFQRQLDQLKPAVNAVEETVEGLPPGGGGGGYETAEVVLNFPIGCGPTESSAAGGPGALRIVGSVHHDTDESEIYLQTSEGWSDAYAAPGEPVTVTGVAPPSFIGDDGDYRLVTSEMELYGPKTDGAWPLGVSLPGWSVIELLAPPEAEDGAEGDWAFLDMGAGAVRVWGPKFADGWPPDYLDFTGVDTSKIKMSAPPAGFSAGDELWIRPGTGAVISGLGTLTMPHGGYCFRRRVAIPIEIPEGAVFGFVFEASAFAKSVMGNDAVQATAKVGETTLSVTQGFTYTLGAPLLAPGTVARPTAAISDGEDGIVYLYFGQGAAGGMGYVTELVGSVKLLVIPEAEA